MITVTLLLLLGTALAFVLAALVRTPAGVPAPPRQAAMPVRPVQPDPLETDVWDARRGDVISVHAAGEDFADLDFPVSERHAYEAASHRWVALSGTWRGREVGLEIFRFPQPEIAGYFDARNPSLADLALVEEQLADMDSRQDPAASFNYAGRRWLYQSSREIRFFQGERGTGEGLYRWTFAEEKGPGLIIIEKWEGEPFDVRLARRVERRDVTVYRSA